MRVSVIIITLNRAHALVDTLKSLKYQSFQDFEVLVVAGPCTDSTYEELARFESSIRVISHHRANINEQRNLGAAHAAGEILAFIDDDALPHPRWLEQIVGGYNNPSIAAVGGIVFDHTGYSLQFDASVCDRMGNSHALDIHGSRHPDRFVHLMGTNCSIRRDVLARIGGFDEEMEYYLDESELFLRLAEQQLFVRMLPRAAVHHRFLPSHVRARDHVIRQPYALVKNKLYFALKSTTGRQSLAVLQDVLAFTQRLLRDARRHQSEGFLSESDYQAFEAEVNRGIRAGLDVGVRGERRSISLPEANPSQFRPYPTIQPFVRRSEIVIGDASDSVESLLPWVLSLAREGNECRLFVRTDEHPRVDFQHGVWIHYLPHVASWVPQLKGIAQEPILTWGAAVLLEIQRIAPLGAMDQIRVIGDPLLQEMVSYHGQDAVREAIGDWLQNSFGLTHFESMSAANWLFDPASATGKATITNALRDTWDASEWQFLSQCYLAIHGRMVRNDELGHWMRLLQEGKSRISVVREVANFQTPSEPFWFRLLKAWVPESTLPRKAPPSITPPRWLAKPLRQLMRLTQRIAFNGVR